MRANKRERRKYHRIPTDQVISYSEENRDCHQAVGTDISKGGIRFEAIGCEIGLGDVLRITFNAGPHTITAVGLVTRSTEVDALTLDVAVEFTEIDPLSLSILEEYTSGAE